MHFEPAWCVLDDTGTDTVHLADASLPEPVIADLNGDGSKEVRALWLPADSESGCPVRVSLPDCQAAALHQVVLVTADAQLLVYAQSSLPDPGCALPRPACSHHCQAAPS